MAPRADTRAGGTETGRLTLVGRLGYAPGDRLLIVTCDDLGSSHAANRACLAALSRGIATGASLMVPCPWAPEAAQLLAAHPVGVHLTFTSEHAGYRWRGLTRGASLHDAAGFLWASREEALGHLAAADAHAEARAQIVTALAWGVDVTHLDLHMDVLFGRPDLLAVYFDLAAEFRLPLRLDSEATRQAARARGLLSADALIYPWPQRTRSVLQAEIPHLAPGVTEIFAHPVEPGPELAGYDSRHAALRSHDAACLTDPAMASLLALHRIRRIGHRALRDLQRAG